MSIRVLVSGAGGKMGREVVRAVASAEGMDVVAAVDPVFAGRALGDLCGAGGDLSGDEGGLSGGGGGLRVCGTLDEAMAASPEVMVDFTAPAAVRRNVLDGVERGLRVVWGTTGMTSEEIEEVRRAVEARGTGAFHAPNFAIGAVLLMLFARKAARYMPAVEIIELHHDQKKDAPSGTAVWTAEKILEAADLPARPETERFSIEGARGGAVGPIHIHSVRLPGFVAHQEAIFGGLGQTLTIRHDSIGRESFMPGVVLAIRRVVDLRGLVVGLENLLDLT